MPVCIPLSLSGTITPSQRSCAGTFTTFAIDNFTSPSTSRYPGQAGRAGLGQRVRLKQNGACENVGSDTRGEHTGREREKGKRGSAAEPGTAIFPQNRCPEHLCLLGK